MEQLKQEKLINDNKFKQQTQNKKKSFQYQKKKVIALEDEKSEVKTLQKTTTVTTENRRMFNSTLHSKTSENVPGRLKPYNFTLNFLNL